LSPLNAEREPAFGRRLEEPDPSAFVRGAGDDGVELLSNLSGQQQRGGGLVDLALNLGGGVFLIGAVLGEFRQFRDGVGQRRAGQRGFQESLRDEIREATVWCGGMRVIFHRQREVSGRFAAGEIQRVFAAADELDDGQGKVGELLRAAARRRVRKPSSATASGAAGSCSLSSAASSTMRAQRSGSRRTRRREGNFFQRGKSRLRHSPPP
jgi:hypothetical protein